MKYTAVQPVSTARWMERRLPLAIGCGWFVMWAIVSYPLLSSLVQALPQLLLVFVSSLLLYLLPGLALLKMLWVGPRLSLAERLSLATGVSLALPPLLLEAAQLVGLRWGSWTVYLYLAVALIVLMMPHRGQPWKQQFHFPTRHDNHILLLSGLVLLTFLLHYAIVHDLPVGMWGDSYHHTMIAQLLVDHGGLFHSWEPYAPLTTFTYHYGFHANVAFFHWLTGMSVPQSLLVMGQILTTLTLPLAYVLTSRWSGSRTAGLWAAVVTGFINIQPNFYVNWGRFTQLSGQLVLPVVLLCVATVLEAPRLEWRALLLAGTMTAGLFLTHYIVAVWAALFGASYGVVLMMRTPRLRAWGRLLTGAGLIGGIAVVLAAPWLWNTLQGYLVRNVAGFVNHSVPTTRVAATATLASLAPNYLDWSILLLGLIGLLLTSLRRNWRMGLFGIWTLLLMLTVIPDRLGLPGTGVISFFTAAIAVYLTVIPLAGYVLARAQATLARWQPCLGHSVALLLIVIATLWGSIWQQHVIDPFYELFTPADEQAMGWIRANTPANALFLVNMFPAYGDTLVAGDDGGWWIPLLTGRRSTLPPITYGSERSEQPDYVQLVNSFEQSLHRTPLPSPAGIQLCRAAGIQYIYSGPHRQYVDYRVDVAALRQHPAFTTVYDHDGVVIFALKAVS